MSLTNMVCESNATVKLAQKIVGALAAKYNFSYDEGWAVVCNRNADTVTKRLKREKKRNDPLSNVKNARTAFSFFTQKQRPLETAAHPEADFGQLSGFVAVAWKNLSAAEKQHYKDMEVADKVRCATEKAAVVAAMPPVVAGAEGVVVEAVAEQKPKRKAGKPKAAAAVGGGDAPVVAVPEVAPVVAEAAPPVTTERSMPNLEVVAVPAANKSSKAKKAPVEAAPAAAVEVKHVEKPVATKSAEKTTTVKAVSNAAAPAKKAAVAAK